MDCLDCWGQSVSVGQDLFGHVALRHPEMEPFLTRICEVLEAPDFIYTRPRTQSYLFYKLGILTGRLYNTYMVGIVRYGLIGEATVRTVYPTTQPARGDLLSFVRPRRGTQ